MSTFVIIGGTGKVGRRVVRLVEGEGHTARAVSRNTSIRFDWRDETTWADALAGADGIFIIGPGSAADWSDLLGRLLELAADAGIDHAVLLSARGVEFLPGGAVDTAERALQDGPLAWTILRPSHFSQNFTEAMFVPVDGRIVAPVDDGREPFIDVEDIAQVAATVLIDREFDNRILDLSGPTALSFDEAAAILSRVANTSIRFETERESDHVAALRAAGTPEGYIEWRMAMLGGIRNGDDAYLSHGVHDVLGRAATSFEEWAAREATAVGA